MKALIQGTRICEVVADDKTFPVHSDLKWVTVADDTVSDKDTWVDDKVVKFSEPTLSYKETRQLAYPPLEDFADAYYWAQKGNDSLMTAYVAACAKVKSDIPKA